MVPDSLSSDLADRLLATQHIQDAAGLAKQPAESSERNAGSRETAITASSSINSQMPSAGPKGKSVASLHLLRGSLKSHKHQVVLTFEPWYRGLKRLRVSRESASRRVEARTARSHRPAAAKAVVLSHSKTSLGIPAKTGLLEAGQVERQACSSFCRWVSDAHPSLYIVPRPQCNTCPVDLALAQRMQPS